MPELDIGPIEARAAAATGGPWEIVKEHHECWLEDDAECGYPDSPIIESETYRRHRGQPGATKHVHASYDVHQVTPVTGNYDYEEGGILETADAVFIAHAPTDIAALLEEVKSLRFDVASAEQKAEDYHEEILASHADRDRALAEVAELRSLERVAEAVAKVTPCACSAQRARAEKAEAEADRLRATTARLTAERDVAIAERHGPYACCEHCADDADWHKLNPVGVHETSCPTCDYVDRRRADKAEAEVGSLANKLTVACQIGRDALAEVESLRQKARNAAARIYEQDAELACLNGVEAENARLRKVAELAAEALALMDEYTAVWDALADAPGDFARQAERERLREQRARNMVELRSAVREWREAGK